MASFIHRRLDSAAQPQANLDTLGLRTADLMVKSGRNTWVWGCPDFRHQGALLVQAPGAAYHFRPVPRPNSFPGGFLVPARIA